MRGARLCLVTDRRLMGLGAAVGDGDGARFGDAIARALDGLAPGAAWVQVREKDLGGAALMTLVRAALAAARPRGVPVIVNDRLDEARAAGADGVHLPEHGLDVATARRLLAAGEIGASVHGVDDAVRAAAAGASLIQLGPIWATPSKAGLGSPLGLAARTAARRALDAAGLPAARLVAGGGIDGAARAAAARAAGADAVAVIRAVWTAADPAAAARALAES